MLTSAITEVHKGNNLLSPGIDRAFSDKGRPRDGNATFQEQMGQLTTREREVLQLVAQGKANKETASELCISIKTVEKHRGNLTEKLGIYGTARLTRYAIAAGVVPSNF
jgi:DNA-binding NarL/FixJ family response regulator